jgi:PPM family protein phosphatase
MFQFIGAAITDVGLRRSSNQDSYLYREDLGLFVVADGMGGHSGGETASRIAVESMDAFYAERAPETGPCDPLEEAEVLRTAVETANRAIFEHAQQHAELRGMGTTLVALRVRGQTGFVAHVGDSRLYRMDGSVLKRVTKDHSRVQELIDAKQLTELEAQSILGRNIITRALGNRPQVEVDTQILDLRPEEAYLLCSDGLCGVLSDEETYKICRLTRPPEPEKIANLLVERVKQNGAPDNVTVVLLLGERYVEARHAQSDLEAFDLYPDTQKILGREARSAEAAGEEDLESEPADGVLLGSASMDPGDLVVHRGSAETLTVLERLVQGVAEQRRGGSGDNGSAAAGEGGDQEETLKLSLGEIEQARNSPPAPARTAPSDGEARKGARPQPAGRRPEPPAPELAPELAAEPARAGTRWPLLVLALLVLALGLVGYVLFGPTRSEILVAAYQPQLGMLQMHRVGMAVGAERGRSLLEGGLGGLLIGLRSQESRSLPLPEEVPEDVWKALRDCPLCWTLSNGGARVASAGRAPESIEAFAVQLYGSLGDYYRDRDAHDKARLFYEKGEQELGSQELRRRRAMAYFHEGMKLQGNKDHATALLLYQRALELGGVGAGMDADLRSRLAAVAYEQAKASLAAGQLDTARATYLLVESYGVEKEKEQLRQMLKKAGVSLDPPAPEGAASRPEAAPPHSPDPVPQRPKPTAAAEPGPGPGDKLVIDDPFREPAAAPPAHKPRAAGDVPVEYGIEPVEPDPGSAQGPASEP